MYISRIVFVANNAPIRLSNQTTDHIEKLGEVRQYADKHHEPQADKPASGRYVVIGNTSSPFDRQD
jgi:hypothetical protein